MNEKWRLILDKSLPGSKNMAIDAAILSAVSEKRSLPTLRFYSWKPAALTIGFFQKIEQELDENACKKDNVSIIRRITGGGAVFHQFEITYSVVFPLEHALSCKTVLESYKKICLPIIDALKSYFLNASFEGINDLCVDGKKISGNAQTRRKGCLLQHGTILLDLNLQQMFSYLKVPKVKVKTSSNAKPAGRVTSLKNLLGEKVLGVEFENDFIKKITRCWEKQNKLSLVEEKISDFEKEKLALFEKDMFANEGWNRNRKSSLL